MKIYRLLIVFSAALSLSSCRMGEDPEDITEYTYKTNIGIVNIDGTNVRYLTDEKKKVYFANFLPNGEKIVYVQDGTMFTMNPDGSNKTPIVSQGIYLTPAFAPFVERIQRVRFTKDSRKIVFAPASDLEYSSSIYCVNIDGSQLVNITNKPNNKIIYGSFGVSSDGSKIVYTEHRWDSLQVNSLCVCNLDGSNKKVLKSFTSVIAQYPQFLPSDDNVIVYFSGKDRTDLTLNRISISDTTVSSSLTYIPSLMQYPFVYGNDKMLYTATAENPRNGFYEIDLSTGIKTPMYLTSLPPDVSVSKDGTLFAWSEMNDKFGVMQPNGSGKKTFQGTAAEQYIFQPFISPSNQQVVFLSSIIVPQ